MSKRTLLSSILLGIIALTAPSLFSATALIEAESFTNLGGWSLDTQFVDIMGSPYLLAHGLGVPVADATTEVELPESGKYHIFVRTKDWVARWKAPGTPGKFKVLVDGTALAEDFGTKGADWFWHDGGWVTLNDKKVTLALHDLTGFDGRCDTLLLTTEPTLTPPNDKSLSAQRKKWLGLPPQPVEAGTFDVVVVGGGYAGLGAAIAAARDGCKVALIQDRPVLGGNGSSEVRVWAMGGTRRGLYPNLGEIVDEFCDHAKASPGTFEEFGDAKKEAIVRAEKNISLFLNHRMVAAEAKDNKIIACTAIETHTSAEKRFVGKFFVDSTGHGNLGALVNADLTVKETEHMGMSNMWRWKTETEPQSFPEIEWGLPMNMIDFPYPQKGHAEWFWEGGFNRDPIKDLEYTRDWNLRAAFGAFNAMKNKDGKEKHLNARLEWVAYIGGTRESRQLLGDIILTRDDIVNQKPFDDGCVPTTWDIDLHYPKAQYAKKFPEDPFISKAEMESKVDRKNGYPVPYRCLYSRNIQNLFMAGRCLSVTHEALGTVRVMKTGGMTGEVVGKAASICLKYDCTPRDVYQRYFSELKELMEAHGKMRRDSVTSKLYMPAGESAPPPVVATSNGKTGVDPKTLTGIIIDDVDAKVSEGWQKGTGLDGFVGPHYLYHSPKTHGEVRYEIKVPKSGKYDVRVSHQPHENRATNTLVTVESLGKSTPVHVNQRVAAPLPNGFTSLGIFEFDAAKPGAVIISTEGANGNVHADAVQLVPAE